MVTFAQARKAIETELSALEQRANGLPEGDPLKKAFGGLLAVLRTELELVIGSANAGNMAKHYQRSPHVTRLTNMWNTKIRQLSASKRKISPQARAPPKPTWARSRRV